MSSKNDHGETVGRLIELSRILGEFGEIKRVTRMPHGKPETDSHHSFSLALIAYELATTHAPELNCQKILLYALVHDLPELESGDVNTLTATTADLVAKAKADALAAQAIAKRLAPYPHLLQALEEYEAKVNDEALFVYWIDKLMTILTHFYDDGKNLRDLGIGHQGDIQLWYDRLLEKLHKTGPGHAVASGVLHTAFQKMHDELVAPAPNT